MSFFSPKPPRYTARGAIRELIVQIVLLLVELPLALALIVVIRLGFWTMRRAT